MRVSFCGSDRGIPKTISKQYTTQKSKENTVVVMGSSKSADSIQEYMDMCANAARAIILADKNIMTGCGSNGIMGAAYNSGKEFSKKNEENKPVQNLAIISEPLWGDEDLDNCIAVSGSSSENDRIEKFKKTADTFLIFPGSATTLQEATTLIAGNYYGKNQDKKQIILVGKDFFKGLDTQYKKLYTSGLISAPPEELYTLVDSEDEILKKIF